MFETQLLTAAATGGLVAAAWRDAAVLAAGTGGRTAAALRAEMTAAGMDPAPLGLWLFVGRAAVVGAFVGLWVGAGMLPVAVAAALALAHAIPWQVRLRIAAYRRRVNAQVGGVARSIAGNVKAGLGLNEALVAVAADAPAPLGDHIRQTATAIRNGTAGGEALAALKARVGVGSVATMAVALKTADSRGGPLADVLVRIAGAADEQARIERKRETDTAAGRYTIQILAWFPLVFLCLVYALDPVLVQAATDTFVGQCVLAAVVGVVYGSVRYASYILARVR